MNINGNGDKGIYIRLFYQNKYKIATIKERKLGVLYKIFLTVIKSNCNGDVATFKKVTMKLM